MTRRLPSRAPLRPRLARRTAAVLMTLLSACAGDIPGSEGGATIDTETFIQAMVDLRVEAAARPEQSIAPAEAESVLDSHGIEGEDLRRFVEVHGENVPLMAAIWAEVERRLEEALMEESGDPSPDITPDPAASLIPSDGGPRPLAGGR